MKIGARTIKSGISILISLLLPSLLGIPDATTLAGISSLASLQPSVKGSWDTLIQRILANSVGGILAILMAYFFGNGTLVIAISAIILISILHAIKLDRVIGLAGATLIIIMLNQTDEIVINAVVRVTGTIIGVTVSFIINRIVMPPKYEEKLFRSLSFQTDELAKIIRSALRKNNQRNHVQTDLTALHKNQRAMTKMYTHMSEEYTFGLHRLQKDKNREFVYHSTRLIVVFRQFLKADKAALDLVESFNDYEHVFNHFPETLRILTRERLETLITAHEQIISKFSGRISAENVNFIEYKTSLREQFMSEYFDIAKAEVERAGNDYSNSNAVIHLMSDIFKYDEEVSKLNRIVRSYRTKHDSDRQEFEEDFDIEG